MTVGVELLNMINMDDRFFQHINQLKKNLDKDESGKDISPSRRFFKKQHGQL